MSELIAAGRVEDILREGQRVVKGGIVVFAHEENIYAVQNRCPHMGFPLHMGSLQEGILTCHWHHARFDVCSGGTLDPWADDVPAHAVQIVDGIVWVDPQPKITPGSQRHFARLQEGLEQNLTLIIAKAVIALVDADVSLHDIARVGILYGVSERAAGWSSGLTILTAMVNVLPRLDTYGQILALVHGLSHVAADCANRPSRHLLSPLPQSDVSLSRLADWYRRSIEVRDTDGALRILQAALKQGADTSDLAALMFSAVTDHFYLDGGHTLDFHNKAFEALSYVKGEDVPHVLTSLVPLMRNATRSEELQNWRAPMDLVTPVQSAFVDLAQTRSDSSDAGDALHSVDAMQAFVDVLLGEQPTALVQAITNALRSGVSAVRVAQLTALAAAERVLRFHTQNDFGDWIAVLHTFTHAHAVHACLRRAENEGTVRAIYHTAMRIYLDRFLNIPAAKRPVSSADQRVQAQTPEVLLQLLDERQKVQEASQWVADYLGHGGSVTTLLQALGHALLREDAEFHSFQMYEAAVCEYDTWTVQANATDDVAQAEFAKRAQATLLYALTRYLAAHAPTARELPHVVRIAWRLKKGERLFEES